MTDGSAGRPPSPTGEHDQHFLVDDRVLDRIVDRAPPGDHALEIGGGDGALTGRLVDRYDGVTVIERDPDLAAYLADRYGDATVVRADATEIDLPEFGVCVSNLPYSASSSLLFELLPRRRPAVVTLQEEVADRLTAGVEDDAYGRLSVAAGYYADAELVERVPPAAFEPPPEVTSDVVALSPRRDPPDVGDPAFFMDLVRGVFTQRRKTFRNALRNTTHITGIDDVEEALEHVPSDVADRRPGALAPDEYADLARRLHGV